MPVQFPLAPSFSPFVLTLTLMTPSALFLSSAFFSCRAPRKHLLASASASRFLTPPLQPPSLSLFLFDSIFNWAAVLHERRGAVSKTSSFPFLVLLCYIQSHLYSYLFPLLFISKNSVFALSHGCLETAYTYPLHPCLLPKHTHTHTHT